MKKQIIFSLLLITSTLTHGMDQPENIQDNNTATNAITPLITTIIRKDYKQQKSSPCLEHSTPHSLIRKYALSYQLCDANVAIMLDLPEISNTITRFAYIAGEYDHKFSDNDLKEAWFLSTTVLNPHLQNPLRQPLVQVALETGNTKKVLQIIKHAEKLNFCYNGNQNPLLTIALKRGEIRKTCGNKYNNKIYNDLLKIAQELLKKGLDINYRKNKNDFTPIMAATLHKDKELAALLLEYETNLYITRYNKYLRKTENAFDLEPRDNWLQDIINTITR